MHRLNIFPFRIGKLIPNEKFFPGMKGPIPESTDPFERRQGTKIAINLTIMLDPGRQCRTDAGQILPVFPAHPLRMQGDAEGNTLRRRHPASNDPTATIGQITCNFNIFSRHGRIFRQHCGQQAATDGIIRQSNDGVGAAGVRKLMHPAYREPRTE